MPVLIRFNGHYLINEFGITADHSEELITISIDERCYKENNQVFTNSDLNHADFPALCLLRGRAGSPHTPTQCLPPLILPR